MLAHAAGTGAPGKTWYVDCDGGNDSADGLSAATAWHSTTAVSAHTFQPGDAVLFRRGSVCSGMLAPRGSGSATAPIHLDAWGSGPLPRIEARSGDEAALKLTDQQYWTIEHLEFSGGDPHGVFVTGTTGVLHGIHIRDVLVHDVGGEPKSKEGGLLVVAPGSRTQRFDEVVIDGVTAWGTSQWSGILVGGVAQGVLPESARSTNVSVRNSVAHDTAGDGIILFQVNDGTIENSIAWHTGMQQTETIGTPNAIWTWMCRDCTVRHNEAFLSDSPGVDGGAFDIDYGDANNVVEENYGHDTQGYCIAVFGAGSVTLNSIIRGNVCSGNGRSPRLALRQGAIFLDTWDQGKLRGVRFSENRIEWNPPIAAPAVVNEASFDGTGTFEKNTIESFSPCFVRSKAGLLFDDNSYLYAGQEPTEWVTGGKVYRSFKDYQRGTSQDAHSRFDRGGSTRHRTQQVSLFAVVVAREQVPELISLHRQFPDMPLTIVTSAPAEAQANLRFDWNTGDIPMRFDRGVTQPGTVLKNAAGEVVWRHDGLVSPAELGLAIRSFLGDPDYARLGAQ